MPLAFPGSMDLTSSHTSFLRWGISKVLHMTLRYPEH